MDFPSYYLPPPPVMTTMHPDCRGLSTTISVRLDSMASAAWPTASLGLFYPFVLTSTATAYQLLFYVGATSGGDIDMAIYDSQKNRIVSAGSTAMSASINTVQELNITDTVLGPGVYLLAVSSSATSGTVFGFQISDETSLAALPVYEQAGLTGATLPDPCVPVVTTSTAPLIAAVGIQFRSSPF